ncbi:hypothetical protein [Butyrivibrio fibrisolvens]|jgi:hypothetical protein|uniref:hypothetical protein n=1 Tax=Butyrivibrio fibrisolvens TaxID=831 RepID=UPI0003B34C48|nr:hypothetical protein [Butyrivibrio fibrisolvens]
MKKKRKKQIFSERELTKIMDKALKYAYVNPFNYMTVDMIESFLDSDEGKDEENIKSMFKSFILLISFCFDKDKAWHQQNPGHREATIENLSYYIQTPYYSTNDFSPHVGIWRKSMSKTDREDRQAAFEYMQELVNESNILSVLSHVQ